MTACAKGVAEVAKLLLEAGADLNAENTTGATPLHYACAKGVLEMANLPLE